MSVLTDINNKDGLHCLVKQFYEKALVDPIIGFFFTDIAKLDLEEHVPKIVSFWEMQLFGTRSYKGNPYRTHQMLDMKAKMKPYHFQRWLTLFQQTVDKNFYGERADIIKRNATSMAKQMSHALSSGHLSSGFTK